MTPSVTESDVLTAVGQVLTGLLDTGVKIVVGQVNRVPSPSSPNYVVMTPGSRISFATNVSTYDAAAATVTIAKSTQFTMQLDIHGPEASDNSQTLLMLLRDPYAVSAFKAATVAIQPLYTSDPLQLPFVNGQQQYEDRWMMNLILQVNPAISTTQDFADTLTPDVLSVDAAFPPGAN